MKLLLEMLDKRDTQPKTAVGDTFHDLAERLKRRGMIIVLSDLFTDPDDMLRGLQHFRHRKHEVIIFHILDRDELTFPFKDASVFEGMEGEEPLMAEPNALRRDYLEVFGAYVEKLKKGCRELNMDYQQLVTDQPVDVVLSRYLSSRSSQRG